MIALGCGGMNRNDTAQGVQLYQQGNYLGAVNHFQEALARQPGNPDCFYNLGATYHQQGKVFGNPADRQVAEQYYHLCLARNPDHVACQRALAVLLVEESRGEEAVANLQNWAVARPANPQPHIELARLAEEHGDVRDGEPADRRPGDRPQQPPGPGCPGTAPGGRGRSGPGGSQLRSSLGGRSAAAGGGGADGDALGGAAGRHPHRGRAAAGRQSRAAVMLETRQLA